MIRVEERDPVPLFGMELSATAPKAGEAVSAQKTSMNVLIFLARTMEFV